jgi:hypothetical protein
MSSHRCVPARLWVVPSQMQYSRLGAAELEVGPGTRCRKPAVPKAKGASLAKFGTRPRNAVCAGKCPTALTFGTILAVWTTKVIRAATSLDASGNARHCAVDLALFLIWRMADSACGQAQGLTKGRGQGAKGWKAGWRFG